MTTDPTPHTPEPGHVLVVYAHPNPGSFTHAVLGEFTRGLREAGTSFHVIDLYASHFDPVFSMHDQTQFVHHTTPERLFDRDELEQVLLGSIRNPLTRTVARRRLHGRSLAELVSVFEQNQPADVRAQQAEVARAEGLAFIAPIFWMGFPAILKGWLERVFAYGFAYTLTPQGWAGDLEGRVPLLGQRRGLIITPTFFTRADYDARWRDAVDTVLCDWCLHMAGVAETDHVYLYSAAAVSAEERSRYLERAHDLGRRYWEPKAAAA